MPKKPGTRRKSEDTAQPSHADSHIWNLQPSTIRAHLNRFKKVKGRFGKPEEASFDWTEKQLWINLKVVSKFRMKVSKISGTMRKNISSCSEILDIKPVGVGSFLVEVVNVLVILSLVFRQIPYWRAEHREQTCPVMDVFMDLKESQYRLHCPETY